MNALDYLLVVLFVIVSIRGGRLGGLSQVASYGAAAVGLLVGALVAPDVAALVADGPGVVLSLVTLSVLVVCLLVAQSVGVAIGVRLRHAAEEVGVGAVDAVAGVAVAVMGLVVTVWLLAAPLSRGPSPLLANVLRTSVVVDFIDGTLPAAPDVLGRVGTYLDQQGFPEVFSDVRPDVTAPPAPTPRGSVVAAAESAARDSVVQVESNGCNSISFGSGFVTRPGYVVTNAHVVAGGEDVVVRGVAGAADARVILFDPDLDLAVLAVPDLTAPPLPWVETPVDGATGATLGYPGGERTLVTKPAAVRRQVRAVGRDIYGVDQVTRDVLILANDVRRGDSGGPFVTGDGAVGGVVFAAAVSEPNTGYALSAASVRDAVATGVSRGAEVDTGACRFS